MRKIIISLLALISMNALAQTEAEEAIILNQELEYLEDSVNRVQARSITPEAQKTKALNEPSLEKTFFGDVQEDEVSTRTASPKRRGI